MPTPSVSVILSIYNKFDYVARVLAGFERQSFRDFEIVLADDGSHEDTIAQLEAYSRKSELQIRHVWHEDKGFRKTKILNKAVQAAAADYLIFVDGDCVPHRHFVAGHFRQKEYSTVLTGRRVMLSERISNRLTAAKILNGALEQGIWWRLLLDSLKPEGTYRLKQGIYIENKLMALALPQKNRGVLGCNFSLHKADLLEINGFDERYLWPGVGEDTDLEYRLRLQGKKFKSVKNYAIQYHLYHKLLERETKGVQVFKQVQQEEQAYTSVGIFS